MNALNVCISLVFVFLVFSIVVSGVQEWWAQFRSLRGKWLRLGLLRLIDDDALFVRVLRHPLVGGLYRDRKSAEKPPSYVEPKNFALALAAVMLRRAAPLQSLSPQAAAAAPLTFVSLRAAVVALASHKSPTADSVLPILDDANGDLAAALNGIEAWFTSGMDRVTGWYKAAAQRRLFVIGFVVAAIGNVDTIALYRALDRSPDLASQIADRATTVVHEGKLGSITAEQLQNRTFTPQQAQEMLKLVVDARMDALPLGYACLAAGAGVIANGNDGKAARAESGSTLERCGAELAARWQAWSPSDWLVHVLGLILTALAATLGAPYWFALLSKIVGIRGSGPKPQIDKT